MNYINNMKTKFHVYLVGFCSRKMELKRSVCSNMHRGIALSFVTGMQKLERLGW
jgi:hypothetical protein